MMQIKVRTIIPEVLDVVMVACVVQEEGHVDMAGMLQAVVVLAMATELPLPPPPGLLIALLLEGSVTLDNIAV